MVRRVLPDQVDDWHLRPACIVQIGEAIAQARSEMKQRARRFLNHARISIGGACDHALEETENATHFLNLIERGDDMDFRCTWIRKADLDASGQ